MGAYLNTWAFQPIVATPDDDVIYGFDFIGLFPSGALSGSPVVSVVDTGDNAPAQTYDDGDDPSADDLTLAAPIVNIAAFANDSGRTVAIGEGVQCRISGGTDGADYVLAVEATNGTHIKTLYCILQIRGAGQPAL